MGAQLEAYEEEEQFVLEFVLPEYAIDVNKTADHKEKEYVQTFKGMLDRENRVLELIMNSEI